MLRTLPVRLMYNAVFRYLIRLVRRGHPMEQQNADVGIRNEICVGVYALD
jgi:hypothetical protein